MKLELCKLLAGFAVSLGGSVLLVSVKRSTPPEKNTLVNISLKSTKSGAGEELVLLDCGPKGRAKGMCDFTDTGSAKFVLTMSRVLKSNKDTLVRNIQSRFNRSDKYEHGRGAIVSNITGIGVSATRRQGKAFEAFIY